MRNKHPLAISPDFLPQSRKENSCAQKSGNLARMQCRAFSISHTMAQTQNSQRRRLQTSNGPQKSNCDRSQTDSFCLKNLGNILYAFKVRVRTIKIKSNVIIASTFPRFSGVIEIFRYSV